MSLDRVVWVFVAWISRGARPWGGLDGLQGRAREPRQHQGGSALADLSTATTAAVADVHGGRSAGTRPGGGIGTHLSHSRELGEDDVAW